MIAINQHSAINVSLAHDQHGRAELLLDICGMPGPALCISPAQARRLALELVQAASNAEVQHTLQKSPEARNRENRKMLHLGLLTPKSLQPR